MISGRLVSNSILHRRRSKLKLKLSKLNMISGRLVYICKLHRRSKLKLKPSRLNMISDRLVSISILHRRNKLKLRPSRLNMISGRLVSISILHRRTSKLLWLFRFNVIQAKLIFISILRRRKQLKNYCRLFIINGVKRFLRRNQKNGNINIFPKELSICCTHWFYNLFIFATQCCRL